MQLDSFNKASAKSGRRLSRLFSGRKSPKTPSPGGGSTPGGSAPASLTLEEMLLYQTVREPRSRLHRSRLVMQQAVHTGHLQTPVQGLHAWRQHACHAQLEETLLYQTAELYSQGPVAIAAQAQRQGADLGSHVTAVLMTTSGLHVEAVDIVFYAISATAAHLDPYIRC